MNGAVLLGLMVPFVGTALGAMMVVFVKSEMNHNMQRAFTGFAAGVMVSASFFSLLIPAVSQASETMVFVLECCSFYLSIRLRRICILTNQLRAQKVTLRKTQCLCLRL